MVAIIVIRTYSELSKFKTFKERFEYLKLDGSVGKDTFGWDRYLNQMLYKSPEWLSVRNKVIVRDCGCDLGLEGYDIFGKLFRYLFCQLVFTRVYEAPFFTYLFSFHDCTPDFLLCQGIISFIGPCKYQQSILKE